MTVYDWFQLTGGVILALGYLPQIRQLLTTRSCKDLNINTYISLAAGIGMMEIYAYNLWVKHSAAMFFATNTISLAMVVYIILLVLSVRRESESNRKIIKDALYATKYIDGSVIITPCNVNMRTKEVNVVYYRRIEADIKEIASKHVVREIAYDRYNATQIILNLQDEGLTMVPFG